MTVHKKTFVEAWVLSKARELGAPIPHGEQQGESPDFVISTPVVTVGIELSEVVRPAVEGGVAPVEAKSFHQQVVRDAEEQCRRTNMPPLRVHVFFEITPRRYNMTELSIALVECVLTHSNVEGVVTLAGAEAPDGVAQIVFWREEQSSWCGVEHGGITASDIHAQIEKCIAAKNVKVSAYRANLPPRAEVWLLLWSAVTVSRGLPMAHGLENWSVPSNFDRVFFCSFLDAQVIELHCRSVAS